MLVFVFLGGEGTRHQENLQGQIEEDQEIVMLFISLFVCLGLELRWPSHADTPAPNLNILIMYVCMCPIAKRVC